MTNTKFNEVLKNQLDYCSELLAAKGDEYDSDTSDRLHSFKTAAALQNETPKQALAGMMCKHTVSVYDMCKGGEYPLEKWIEKITDSINYLILLRAMVEEEKYDG